jgi:hypothetical protein
MKRKIDVDSEEVGSPQKCPKLTDKFTDMKVFHNTRTNKHGISLNFTKGSYQKSRTLYLNGYLTSEEANSDMDSLMYYYETYVLKN